MNNEDEETERYVYKRLIIIALIAVGVLLLIWLTGATLTTPPPA